MFLLRNVPSGEERPLFLQANLRVRSIRKSRFRFENPDFGFAIEREIRKRISTLRYLSLPFDWEIRKRIWKTFLKNSGLARARIISKKRTVKMESMKSAFGFLYWNPPRGRISRRWNPFSDFAFDSKIQNPDFKSKSGYSNRTQPLMYFTSA